jgi:C-terminal processing protease CtpA/Prc
MNFAALASCVALIAPQNSWTHEEMTADLDQLVAALRERWAYCEDRTANNGLDLDALLAASLAGLEEVYSKDDFAMLLRKFVATLEDGHGGVSFEGDTLPTHYVLLTVAACPEGFVLSSVGDDMTVAAEARAPSRGDLLIAIDGRPTEEVLRELESVTTGSTPGQRRAKALKDLRIAAAEEVEVELEDTDGERFLVRLRTRAWPLMPERDNWGLSWPREDVALLRIDSFAVHDWAAWLRAAHEDREPFLRETYGRIAETFAELDQKEARALIIDLRGNGGGTDALGRRLAQHLIGETFTFLKLSARRDGAWSEPFGYTYEPEGAGPFEGRLVALTDERSFSTTDNFLRCMRDLHPRFTVVGRPTGAGTGAPATIATLNHSGARIRACTMRVYGPLGGLIEGRGTTPDIPVTWTRADVLAGRDPDLDAALQALDE